MPKSSIIPQHNEPFRSVLIFGPPGSGKGTLGKFLSSAGNHFHLSSGDIFRGLSPDSPAGKIYEKYAGKGLLLPDIETIVVLEVHNMAQLVQRLQRRAIIEKRLDDMDTNVLRTRMEVYNQDTSEVLGAYPASLIARFNAEQKPLEVLRDVLINLADILS